MIYLYAIVEPGAEPPRCLGLEDEALVSIPGGGVAGLCSRHDRGSFDPEPATLWRHDRVVEAAMAGGTVLPARFGTTFADTRALQHALEGSAQRLRHQLDALLGCVELAVRISLPEESPATRSGGEYLQSRIASRRERQALLDRTLVPLEAHALRAHTGAAEGGDLTASYLVHADAVDSFAARVRTLAERHSELALSCTGPWPPYSFVDEGDA